MKKKILIAGGAIGLAFVSYTIGKIHGYIKCAIDILECANKASERRKKSDRQKV